MRRIKVERRSGKIRDDHGPVLPLDPRDKAVIRAKQRARDTQERA
jgi:hypothetical protein